MAFMKAKYFLQPIARPLPTAPVGGGKRTLAEIGAIDAPHAHENRGMIVRREIGYHRP